MMHHFSTLEGVSFEEEYVDGGSEIPFLSAPGSRDPVGYEITFFLLAVDESLVRRSVLVCV